MTTPALRDDRIGAATQRDIARTLEFLNRGFINVPILAARSLITIDQHEPARRMRADAIAVLRGERQDVRPPNVAALASAVRLPLLRAWQIVSDGARALLVTTPPYECSVCGDWTQHGPALPRNADDAIVTAQMHDDEPPIDYRFAPVDRCCTKSSCRTEWRRQQKREHEQQRHPRDRRGYFARYRDDNAERLKKAR